MEAAERASARRAEEWQAAQRKRAEEELAGRKEQLALLWVAAEQGFQLGCGWARVSRCDAGVLWRQWRPADARCRGVLTGGP